MNGRRTLIVIVALLAGLSLGVDWRDLPTADAAAKPLRPRITWTPRRIVVRMEPGETRDVELNFQSSRDAPVLWVRQRSRRDITVVPHERAFTHVTAGTSNTLMMNLSIPDNVRPGRRVIGMVWLANGRSRVASLLLLQVLVVKPTDDRASTGNPIVAEATSPLARDRQTPYGARW